MSAAIWVIIFILILTGGIYLTLVWFNKIPEPAKNDLKTEKMLADHQYCSNCAYKNVGKCESPLLYYYKINLVSGQEEKNWKLCDFERRCNEIVGGKYCQWKEKE